MVRGLTTMFARVSPMESWKYVIVEVCHLVLNQKGPQVGKGGQNVCQGAV